MVLRTSLLLFCALAPAWAQPAGKTTTPPGASTSVDLNSLDRTVDPCVDFYRYACGSWLAHNPVPPDQTSWGRFDELAERNRTILRDILEAAAKDNPGNNAVEREIGDFYSACMDEKTINQKGLAPVKPILDRIAALPNKAAITHELIELGRTRTFPFFSFDSEQDFKDATQMIGVARQGGLGLPDRDYYLKTDEKSVEIRAQYVAHVQKMFQLAGDTADSAARKARAVMDIETSLAKASLDVVSLRDPQKVYHKYTVHELVSLCPGIDWKAYFTGMGVGDLQTLNVQYPPFIRQIESVMVVSTLDDLKAYLTWQTLNWVVSALPNAFVEEDFDFYDRKLNGAREMMARWKRCVDRTDNLLGDALGQKYVERTFGPEGKERTLKMVREIEAAMQKNIETLDWMTAETKKQALIKLHAVANKIGYPDRWKDYSAVKIARDDNFGNSMRLRTFAVNFELAKIGKPVDRSLWQMTPPTVNAYYDPQLNDINFPAGILQPPFYGNNVDAPVNYGGIGSVIGHELTHGFDDQGRQFDAHGNLRDWWTPADAKAFEKRADCVANQYSQYTVSGDAKLNGRLTLGENVADNGGLRLAWMALMSDAAAAKESKKEGFTPGQRYFLGYAQSRCENMTPEAERVRANIDPHSPARYRVNGVVSNMTEFGKAFSCRAGLPMVSGPSCRVW